LSKTHQVNSFALGSVPVFMVEMIMGKELIVKNSNMPRGRSRALKWPALKI